MEIGVDHDSGEPVYRQVARQIRECIAYEGLAPGSRLPSVRTLGSDLGVNLNTVARAYRALEEEGFVSIVGRSKVIVAAPRAGGATGEEAPTAQLLTSLRETLAKLRQAGFGAEDLKKRVTLEIESMAGIDAGTVSGRGDPPTEEAESG